MFKITPVIQIVQAFGCFVVYRSALSGKSPVYAQFGSVADAVDYRNKLQDPTRSLAR